MRILLILVFMCLSARADMTQQAAAAARTNPEVANGDKIEVAKKAIEGAVGKEVAAVINRQIDTAAKQEEANKTPPTNAERAEAEAEVVAEEKAEELCRACKAAKGAKNCPCAFMEAEDAENGETDDTKADNKAKDTPAPSKPEDAQPKNTKSDATAPTAQ